ncbi:MAG: HAMP domain-containing sensor histidine kinase [Pseudoflavonifractor sp.]
MADPTLTDQRDAILLEQLRQQVTNLMAATHLLTPVIRESGDEKYDRYLAIMNQSFYRLLRLMNHLEQARDLDREGGTAELGAMDLAGLCHGLTDEVIPLARAAGVEFQYETETASLLTTGDADALRRLLLELISNALHAAGEGGQAGLRLVRQADCALITVWDTGETPPEPAEGKIYRSDGGLGLGLKIARQLAALHGGAIMLEKRPQRGMRAILSLPIRKPEGAGLLCTPRAETGSMGGFPLVLVELADLLPFEAFLPADLE